jgi:hypothetical protein
MSFISWALEACITLNRASQISQHKRYPVMQGPDERLLVESSCRAVKGCALDRVMGCGTLTAPGGASLVSLAARQSASQYVQAAELRSEPTARLGTACQADNMMFGKCNGQCRAGGGGRRGLHSNRCKEVACSSTVGPTKSKVECRVTVVRVCTTHACCACKHGALP